MYVLDAKNGEDLALENYLLSVDKIQAAPGTSAVHTQVTTVADDHFKRCGAFRDPKKTYYILKQTELKEHVNQLNNL